MENFNPIKSTLICLSHLRWDFVYQRPQHIMSRFANFYTVLYIEEPIVTQDEIAFFDVIQKDKNIYVLVPNIPANCEHSIIQAKLLEEFINRCSLIINILWYYTPLAALWSKAIPAQVRVYDCMDELSAFKGASAELPIAEAELLSYVDLVFTGGLSLYAAKKDQHKRVYSYPSSVDIKHFSTARQKLREPITQASIPYPRIGFYGVIDERFDIELVAFAAKSNPNWQFIIIGPIVKINPDSLPKNKNIHYLGAREYGQLPSYIASWDVAMLPFAINEATKFISPTKTPEYLASGKPVVSTAIKDVITTYDNIDIVHIANNKDEFIQKIDLALKHDKQKIYQCADIVLQDMSWDKTFNQMHNLILELKDNIDDHKISV